MDASELFVDSGLGAGPDVTAADIEKAEHELGVTLPQAYKDLILVQNGGYTESFAYFNPWSPHRVWDGVSEVDSDDFVGLRKILGVGHRDGIDGELGSRYLTEEWEYPDIGVVVASTPHSGHETIMLDYREPGEPKVAWIQVDEDSVGDEYFCRVIADSFREFLDGLGPDPYP